MTIQTTKIPRRQKCVDKNHPYIGGTADVIDDNKNKTQEQINSDTEERVSTLEENVGTDGSVDERIAAAVAPKANKANVYTKSETYNKTELDNMITTPEVEYVNVEATDQTTNISDVLPATGASNTIYKIGNWDGSQYDISKYSEYTWNGSAYVYLATRDHGVDDEPIKNSQNIPKSGGVYNTTIQVNKNKNKKYIHAELDSLDRLLFGINRLGEVVIPNINTLIKTKHLKNKCITPEKIDMGEEITDKENKPVSAKVIHYFVTKKEKLFLKKEDPVDKKYIFSLISKNDKLILGVDNKGRVEIPNLYTFSNLFSSFTKSLHFVNDKKYIFAIADAQNRILLGIKKSGHLSSVSIDYLIDYINEKIDNISINIVDTEGSTWLDRTELLLNKKNNDSKNLANSSSGEIEIEDSVYEESLVDKNGFPIYTIDKDGNFIIQKLVLIDETTGNLYNLSINNGQINITFKN